MQSNLLRGHIRFLTHFFPTRTSRMDPFVKLDELYSISLGRDECGNQPADGCEPYLKNGRLSEAKLGQYSHFSQIRKSDGAQKRGSHGCDFAPGGNAPPEPSHDIEKA